MTQRWIPWTVDQAALFLLLACFIGLIHEGASSCFVLPESRRHQAFAHPQPIRRDFLSIGSHFVLHERRPKGAAASGILVSKLKDQSNGGVVRRPPATSKKRQPTSGKVSKSTKSSHSRIANDEGSNVRQADDDDEEEEVDVHRVSDATALLACRAYLIRRRRLGPWKKQQERRDRLMRSSLYRKGSQVASSASSAVPSSPAPASGSRNAARTMSSGNEDRPDHIGYFWEDTAELKYYVSPRRRRSFNNRLTMEPNEPSAEDADVRGGVRMVVGAEDDDPCDTRSEESCNVDVDDDDGESSSWEFASSRSLTSEEEAAVDDLCDELDDDEFQADDGGTEDAGVLGGVGGTGPSLGWYDPFDDLPPPSYVRRSQAAKKCWSQPQFRQKWYEARWGGAEVKAARQSKQVDADKERLRRVSSSAPLPMEAVAEMSEEEIAHAIRTYLSSKHKKRHSKEPLPTFSAPDSSSPSEDGGSSAAPAVATLESLLPTNEVLQQRQIERSERAAKAYQTRLANQRLASQSAKKRRRTTHKALDRGLGGPLGGVKVTSPVEAMERIEKLLNAGTVPLSSDVELALKPIKLPRRKQLLRRILADCFGLRGKCVPSADEEPESAATLTFVTKASIEELGVFCLSLIREVESSK